MYPTKLKDLKIILASQSPRRQQLLKGIGIDFKVLIMNDIPEVFPDNLRAEQIALYLAELKAIACENHIDKNNLLITADTIVLINDKVLCKPAGRKEAIEMLTLLSGNKHEVITAVCIWSALKKISFYDISEVWFRKLSPEEIEYYVTHYEPFDKAGAYGVQEWIGYVGIERVEGSYFNVMGLPIHRVYEELIKF